MNETAVITGAGSGIGRATAHVLVARGASVGLLDIDRSALDAVAAELPSDRVMALQVDVRDPSEVEEGVTAVVDRFGGLDTVVASAGIEVQGEVPTLSVDAWQRAIDINLTGVFLLARASIPFLIASPRASFVAVASDSGVTGAQGWPAYGATKHAVVGLIRSMALDHGPDGVRFNAVCPGWVKTALLERVMDADVQAKVARRIPLQRIADPEDVAHVIAHLCAPETPHTTGTAYVIDGGEMTGAFSPPRR